jgi:hypothetical protein
MELDEAMAQWKTRTHVMKYVQEVVRSSPNVPSGWGPPP